MRIVILRHSHNLDTDDHLIDYMAAVWRERGDLVEFVKGPEAARRVLLSADVVIPHIDLTQTPPEYADLLSGHPCVVNRNVLDISKRRISRHLVEPGDGYEGPIIVKTDANYGGQLDTLVARGEANLLTRAINKVGRILPGSGSEIDLATAASIPGCDYPIFERVADLPAGVFENQALVVERFLPEVEDGRYYTRCYLFLGDHSICARLGGANPIVKNDNIDEGTRVEVDPEIEALRQELGFDYGKFDYVIHEGQAILLDANRTPGRPGPEEESIKNGYELAPGLDALISR